MSAIRVYRPTRTCTLHGVISPEDLSGVTDLAVWASGLVVRGSGWVRCQSYLTQCVNRMV